MEPVRCGVFLCLMKIAYADPPYIGAAKKHYRNHPDYAGEVDHPELIGRLVDEYPDGWALSLSAKSIQYILSICPPDVRVLAWVKPYHGFLAGIRMQYGWEPVIMRGGRQGRHITGSPVTLDWLKASPEGFTFRSMPEGHVTGKKPKAFCYWLFQCMGLQSGDEFDDLFPGTGAVGRAWEKWCNQLQLV